MDDVLGAHAEATMAATRDALAAGHRDGRVLGAPDVNKINVCARRPTRGFAYDGNELDDVLGAHAEATMAATRDALAAGHLDGRVLGEPDVNKINVCARRPTRGFATTMAM